MNTGERVKVLRKDMLGLTLDRFGDRLHVGKSAISDIERGRNNLSEQMLFAICREFGVNEAWLRTGEGEPFVEKTRSEQIREYFSRLDGLSENFKDRFADALAALDENDWEIIDELVDRLKKQGRGNRAREEERQRLHADIDRQLDEKGSQGAGRSASTSGLQGTAG